MPREEVLALSRASMEESSEMADNAVGIAFTSEHKWHDGKAIQWGSHRRAA